MNNSTAAPALQMTTRTTNAPESSFIRSIAVF